MAHTGEKSSSDTPLLRETIGSMILDSETTSTVGGLDWFNCFVETLTEEESQKLETFKGSRTFKFGTGQRLSSLKRVILPRMIGGVRVDISADIIDADIPLFLSKSAMKRAKTLMDFEKDTICLLGRKIKLNTTTSGHYYVPITKPMPTDQRNARCCLFGKSVYFSLKILARWIVLRR